VDLIGILLNMEGIGEVIAPIYSGVTLVHSPDKGEATVYRRDSDAGAMIAYQALDPKSKDPFGYLAHPVVSDMACTDASMDVNNFTESRFDGHFYPLREWVSSTRDSEFPGAAALIPKAFVKHNTTSDIIVNSRQPYNFSKYFRGDHGALMRGAVMTSFLASGPGIKPRADLSNILWVDLLPTLLKLMKIEPPSTFSRSIDGEVFSEFLDD
jgi:arylsulfatase A-like enzyme